MQFLIVQLDNANHVTNLLLVVYRIVQLEPEQFVLLQTAVQFVLVITQLVPVQFFIEQLAY